MLKWFNLQTTMKAGWECLALQWEVCLGRDTGYATTNTALGKWRQQKLMVSHPPLSLVWYIGSQDPHLSVLHWLEKSEEDVHTKRFEQMPWPAFCHWSMNFSLSITLLLDSHIYAYILFVNIVLSFFLLLLIYCIAFIYYIYTYITLHIFYC